MRRLWLRFQSVTTISSCVDILTLLTKIRGGVNGLIAEILQDHIRLHMMNPDQEMESPEELAEDLIGPGAGLSKLAKQGTLRILGGSASSFVPPTWINRPRSSQRKEKRRPGAPEAVLRKPSRLEGQLDDLRLPGRCCKMMAGE
jgi:hypothetical protein